MPATARGSLASKTFCNTSATTVSWTTHRMAAVTNVVPKPREKAFETVASNAMKQNASPTCDHVRLPLDWSGGVSMVDADRLACIGRR